MVLVPCTVSIQIMLSVTIITGLRVIIFVNGVSLWIGHVLFCSYLRGMRALLLQLHSIWWFMSSNNMLVSQWGLTVLQFELIYIFLAWMQFLTNISIQINYHGEPFGLAFKFIDDLLTVNNKYLKNMFLQFIQKNYNWKKWLSQNRGCSFLDLFLFNDDGELNYRVYDSTLR